MSIDASHKGKNGRDLKINLSNGVLYKNPKKLQRRWRRNEINSQSQKNVLFVMPCNEKCTRLHKTCVCVCVSTQNENCLHLCTKWNNIVCVLMKEHRNPFGVSSRINYASNMQNLKFHYFHTNTHSLRNQRDRQWGGEKRKSERIFN